MNSNKHGFTLGGIFLTAYIAVVVLVFLACFIPRTSRGSDARLSNLTTDLQSIRAQIELYKTHHNGALPKNLTIQLTGKTDSDGRVNNSGAWGPYMKMFPVNPFLEDRDQAYEACGTAAKGWFYNSRTGEFRANTTGHEHL
jgi:general secretion pathway protein G